MFSKSLKDAIAEAEAENPTTGTPSGGAWEDEKNVVLTIVASNADVENQYGAQVGIQVERGDTNRRKWFNLKFDEENSGSYAQTGRKLKDLGMLEVVDVAAETYPIKDSDSPETKTTQGGKQLQMIADALVGVKFDARITKKQSQRNKENFNNFFDVNSLIEGPSVPTASTTDSSGGLGGLGGLMG